MQFNSAVSATGCRLFLQERAEVDDKVVDQQDGSRQRDQEQDGAAGERLQNDVSQWLRSLPKAERQDHFTGSVSGGLLISPGIPQKFDIIRYSLI